jgi:hypothetical protein
MSFNFVTDRIVAGRAYPTLATFQADPYSPEWQQFIQHHPYTIPVDLFDYCKQHNFSSDLHTIEKFPPGSFYVIAPGIFRCDVDYIGLLNPIIKAYLKLSHIRLLFYYHEGDNPHVIKELLDQRLIYHGLPLDCYYFISANTEADQIPRFAYFPCHELIYWSRNQSCPATPINHLPRQRDFTVLSRTHKRWRATVMTDLHLRGLLENAYWSYNTSIHPLVNNDCEVDNVQHSANPIQTGSMFDCHVDKFLAQGSYHCDSLTAEQHNDHSQVVTEHYTNSYCSIILETHFDTDRSQGAFLSEKTFKAIKHGHPFIIVGTPGSLAQLRSLGYRTFDHAIDPDYDQITDPTQRWLRIAEIITDLKSKNLHDWFESCVPDIIHNQLLFSQSKHNRLNNLHDKLLHQLATT